jgi:hypothetical protein
MGKTLAVVVTLLAGCTSLGPNPATTGIGARPMQHLGGELTLGLVPGHYLSSGVTSEPKGSSIQQGSLLFEPDRLIAPGLMLAARVAGNDEAGVIVEPMLGYRRVLGPADRFALAGIAFGTHSSRSRDGASYRATRVGAEVAGDARLTPVSRILELHVFGGGAVTHLDAEGSYCINSESGYGVDCPDDASEPRTTTDGAASGLYPTGHVGAAVELGRNLRSLFRGARIALSVSGGWMPTLVAGAQGRHTFAAAGLSLTLGLGSMD